MANPNSEPRGWAMSQIYLPELWLGEWEVNILGAWEQLLHRMFYLSYSQPGLILDVCQSPFLTLKVNESYLISHAQIKRYASFISATIFCFLPMLYLKAHKTNGFVLIKRKALETSYSLAAQSWTDDGKLLINPFKLKYVVKLRFYCVLEARRHFQASAASRVIPVYLHAPKRHVQKSAGIINPGNVRRNLFM